MQAGRTEHEHRRQCCSHSIAELDHERRNPLDCLDFARLTVGFYVTAVNEAVDFELVNILPMPTLIAKELR